MTKSELQAKLAKAQEREKSQEEWRAMLNSGMANLPTAFDKDKDTPAEYMRKCFGLYAKAEKGGGLFLGHTWECKVVPMMQKYYGIGVDSAWYLVTKLVEDKVLTCSNISYETKKGKRWGNIYHLFDANYKGKVKEVEIDPRLNLK